MTVSPEPPGGEGAPKRAAVIGAGSWGTALAMQLARAGRQVGLWDRDSQRAAEMQRTRENSRYLPGFELHPRIRVTGVLEEAIAQAQLVVSVVPSQVTRQMAERYADLLVPNQAICVASKGIEQGTLSTMDAVLRDVLPQPLHSRICVLSGPSFAKEVAADLPTAVVVAGADESVAAQVADAFHSGHFRVYHTDDVVGAELGGALKNVMAIACGMADGAGLGDNARAALITRGLAEITRLAVARGANPLTLMGLSGMGDLVLTCTGGLSRNRRVGLGLGQGKRLEEILEALGQVAEGVTTTRSARNLGLKLGVDMPITHQMYRVLYEDLPVLEALAALMGRERKAERG
jgi:glycerol-3-phosphate dehydrogenase (NAD(P)+)